MANKRKKRRMSGRKKITLFVAELLLLLVVVAIVVVWHNFSGLIGKIQFDDQLTSSEAGVNEDIEESSMLSMGKYTNIALFGLDNRSSAKYDSGNSDSIMIASINNDTKEIKIASVYRDTYLNAAYARGGVKNAVRCLNENLDLNIVNYVCVDWNALVEAIDALGGVEIKITDDEVEKINYYVNDTARCTDAKPHEVTESGTVTLDGIQATSYARIRYDKGMDMLRASRQRIVLQAMMKKVKKADFSTLTNICNVVFDDIQTSLSLKDILYLAKSVTSYELAATAGFPSDVALITMKKEEVEVPVDLYSNVVTLHEFLFDEKDYVASQTVQNRNNAISEKTGVTIDSSEKMDLKQLDHVVGAEGTDALWEKAVKEATESTEDSSKTTNDN